MGQPVKLSDALVMDARLMGEAAQRSIAGQVEYWARLGRSVELLLNGQQVLQLCKSNPTSLSELMSTVNQPSGKKRLEDYLESQPFPHYRPHPERKGLLERIEKDGTVTAGTFVNREFKPAPSVRNPKQKR